MSIKMTAVVYKAGTTIYDENTVIDSSLMKQMVNDFNEHYQNAQINHYHYGTFSDNSFPNINFEDITHKINNVYIKDDRIMADIDILDTPKGKDLQELLEHNNVKPSLDLIKHDGKLDIRSVSFNYFKKLSKNYEK